MIQFTEGYPLSESEVLVLGKAKTIGKLKKVIVEQLAAIDFDHDYEMRDFKLFSKADNEDTGFVIINSDGHWAYGYPYSLIQKWADERAERGY